MTTKAGVTRYPRQSVCQLVHHDTPWYPNISSQFANASREVFQVELVAQSYNAVGATFDSNTHGMFRQTTSTHIARLFASNRSVHTRDTTPRTHLSYYVYVMV